MKIIQYTRLAARIVVVCWAVGTVCHSLPAQQEIRFRLVNNLIVASLNSDHAGPFDFVLDTGADTTVIDPSVASQFSFVPVDRIPQTTISGVQTVTRGRIGSLSIGSLRVNDVVVLVQDLRGLRNIDSHIRGIAGQNFLSHFNYLLDYRKRTVRFELGSEIENTIDGDRVPIDAGENRMLVPCAAESKASASLRLMLDSGASTVVFLPRAAQVLNLSRQGEEIELTSSGQSELNKATVRALTIGSQQFHELTAMLPTIVPAERIGDGMLPTVMFRALYINNHERFVVFNPRIKPDAPLNQF